MPDRIRYLARTYFHPDYGADAPTPLDVVRQFRRAETEATVEELISDVRALLASSDEESMRNIWLNTYDAYYEPERDGMTYREWFERVLEVLREPR